VPDFERAIDSLREHLAKSPEDKAWAKGYAAGKSQARREVFIVLAVIYFGIAALGRFFGA
jgi:hypothetical protein